MLRKVSKIDLKVKLGPKQNQQHGTFKTAALHSRFNQRPPPHPPLRPGWIGWWPLQRPCAPALPLEPQSLTIAAWHTPGGRRHLFKLRRRDEDVGSESERAARSAPVLTLATSSFLCSLPTGTALTVEHLLALDCRCLVPSLQALFDAAGRKRQVHGRQRREGRRQQGCKIGEWKKHARSCRC